MNAQIGFGTKGHGDTMAQRKQRHFPRLARGCFKKIRIVKTKHPPCLCDTVFQNKKYVIFQII
jgi:hypothetical protein